MSKILLVSDIHIYDYQSFTSYYNEEFTKKYKDLIAKFNEIVVSSNE